MDKVTILLTILMFNLVCLTISLIGLKIELSRLDKRIVRIEIVTIDGGNN